MNRKHYVVYFDENDNLVYTKPKDWTRKNQTEFPDFNLEEDTPTTNQIAKHLIFKHSFMKIENNHRVISIKI